MKPTHFFQNFVRCGIAGWCLEIFFTAMHALQKREMALCGTTSLWMFPIYGMGAIIAPLYRLLHRQSIWLRGFLYTLLILTVEFISGSYLRRKKCCPWNYHRSPWNVRKSSAWLCSLLVSYRPSSGTADLFITRESFFIKG